MKKEDKVLIKNFLKYFRPYLLQCITLVLIIMIGVSISLIQPILWSKLITSLFGSDLRSLYRIVVLFAVLFLLTVLINFMQSTLMAYLNTKIVYDLQQKLFENMLSMKTEYFDSTPNGTIISKITGDTKQIVDLIIKSVLPDIIAVLKLIFSFILMIRISWQLTLLTIIFLPMLIIYYTRNSNKMRQKQADVRKSNDSVVSSIQQAISGIINIKALGLKIAETEIFQKDNYNKYKIEFGFSFFIVIFQTIISLISLVGEAAVFAVGGYLVLSAFLSVEKFIQFTSYSQQFNNSSLTLVNLVTDYQKILVSIRRLYEIEESVSEQHEQFGKLEYTLIKPAVEFRNVGYSYAKRMVFSNINFKIKENSLTVLTGESGCGKSTIIKLLLGLYKADTGEILLDGVNINSMTEESIRNMLSVVTQQHFFINVSIEDNFKYINADMDIAAMKEICQKCGIDEMISGLPEGYKTIIGENGCNFSVGQLQRLSIARVMAKDTPIILFDEPTAALDNESTERIFKLLFKLKNDKTILVVSHNKSITEYADQIIDVRRIKKGD